jgi:hypothetical protein
LRRGTDIRKQEKQTDVPILQKKKDKPYKTKKAARWPVEAEGCSPGFAAKWRTGNNSAINKYVHAIQKNPSN